MGTYYYKGIIDTLQLIYIYTTANSIRKHKKTFMNTLKTVLMNQETETSQTHLLLASYNGRKMTLSKGWFTHLGSSFVSKQGVPVEPGGYACAPPMMRMLAGFEASNTRAV